MVMRLPLPNINSLDLIEVVVAERQSGPNAGYFTGIQNAWKARITEFIQSQGNPEVVRPWVTVAVDRQKYLTLFEKPARESAQGNMLSQLRSRELQLCPACGEDGTPNTLDHYLPKGSYPEFAIAPPNLTPMCDICQGEKLDRTLDGDDQRLFLQPYFDQFLGTQVLVLIIEPPYHAPAPARIEPNPGLPVPQFALVQRHLEALDIPRRFNRFFRDQYVRLLKLTRAIREKDQNVRESLQTFETMAASKSVNSWLHVFYAGVLANEELLQFLEYGDLPEDI